MLKAEAVRVEYGLTEPVDLVLERKSVGPP